MVTGITSNSRLQELKKYVITNVFEKQYISGGTLTNNGVDYQNSVSGVNIRYYIDGVMYVDNISMSATTVTSSATIFILNAGTYITNNPNFINYNYYQDTNYENIISLPKINDDVFIERQELSVFDKNYRLEYIRNLIDIQTYVGGKFFNIINNT